MIGVYDYTVILTYLSLLSAGAGIVVSLSGPGHPYAGVFFLMFCGLCDAFDGMVARTKKNRTEMEKRYGIQIDSLSDIVAFGVLPACIGVAIFRHSETLNALYSTQDGSHITLICFVLHAILLLYILAALIRLAYFNVTEELRQSTDGEQARKEYTGLPVTSASLIFPTVMLFDFFYKPFDLSLLYFAVAILTGFAFLFKFKVKKPGRQGVFIMVCIGAAEGLFLLLCILVSKGAV